MTVAGVGLLLALPTLVRAQDTAPAAAAPAAATATVAVKIPAGPLGAALAELAKQANLKLAVPAELVADKTAPAVEGTLTPADALAKVLAGSGLEAVEGADGLTVRRIVDEEEAPEAEVSVSAKRIRENGRGPVNGYVAKQSASAMKTDMPLIETPQSITVVTKDQVRDQLSQTIQDAVRYSAGVRADTYGLDNRGDWFTLRGVSEGSTVLDGLRRPLSGYYGNVRDEPYAFERIEVLRGPAAVVIGQNSPGGVINLVSKRPQAQEKHEFGVELGNYRHKRYFVDSTGPLNSSKKLLFRFVSVGNNSGTQVHFADDQREYFAPSVTWRPSDRTSLTTYLEYQRDESGNTNAFLPWAGTILPGPNGRISDSLFISEPGFDSYGGQRLRLGYAFEHQLNDKWKLRHNVRHDRVQGHMRTMYANWFDGFLPDNRSLGRTFFATRTNTRADAADFTAEGKFEHGKFKHTLLLGIDGAWSSDDNATFDAPATPLDVYDPTYGTFPLPALNFPDASPFRTKQIGILVQDQIKYDEKWVLVGGIRRDKVRTSQSGDPTAGFKDGAYSSRVGLVHLGDNGIAPYLSYSESFDVVNGQDTSGTPYKPKTGKQVEAGLRWAPKNSPFSASAAVFALEEKNILTADPLDPFNSLQGGAVESRGLELEANANLPKWDLIAQYTYTNAKYTKSSDPADGMLGKRPAAIPENAAALWALRKFETGGKGKLRVGGGVRFIGKTYDGADIMSVPSVTLLDALVSYEKGKIRYSLNANNVLDKSYVATVLSRGDAWFGSRRKLVASVSYGF